MTSDCYAYAHLLIPLIAITLLLLSFPTSDRIVKSRRLYGRSNLACDAWTVLSSILVLIVWATCDLHFDGIDLLVSSSTSSSSFSSSSDVGDGVVIGAIVDNAFPTTHPASNYGPVSINATCDDDYYCPTETLLFRQQQQQQQSGREDHGHPSVDEVSNSISEHCWLSAFILGTAMILELLQVIAHRMVAARQNKLDVGDDKRLQRRSSSSSSQGSRHRHPSSSSYHPRDQQQQSHDNNNNNTIYTLFDFHDSECLLLVYLLLFLTHILMSNDRAGLNYGLIFAEPMAARMGHYRPVSTIRYVEWSIASPLCMSLIGRSIPRLKRSDGEGSSEGNDGKAVDGDNDRNVSDTLRPALLITVSYIFSSWLSLLVIQPHYRHSLIAFAFIGYTLSAIDQLTSWKRNADPTALCSKTYSVLLSIQILGYSAYGAVFLLSLADSLDPIAEQAALTYADATIKLTVSATLAAVRHADSLAEARRERNNADAIASDLAAIIHDANAPIFALDEGGNIKLWNHKLARLTGVRLEDVVGRPLVGYLSRECRSEFLEVFEKRKGGRGDGMERYHCDFINMISKQNGDDEDDGDDDGEGNGATRDNARGSSPSSSSSSKLATLLMTATSRHDASGNFIGIVGIGSDLTEVTRIRLVEEKKNQFMAVVSHELKSPLHGIIGLSESLSQSERNLERKGRLRMVKSCAIRLLDLVSNIMQMSRLTRDGNLERRSDCGSKGCRNDGCNGKNGNNNVDGVDDAFGGSGRETLRKDLVDVPSIVNEVCVLVSNATDKGNRPLLNPLVTLENRLGPSPSSSSNNNDDNTTGTAQRGLPIVEGDAYKITQVFYNILTNACKFCTHGSIVIDADINRERDTLEVSIADTGVGIQPESVKRIFEPFEQESNSSRRSFGGIGLGLAISKQVIQLHGGDVSVTSTPGKGSKFVISLPVTKEAVALWASSSSNSSAAGAASSSSCPLPTSSNDEGCLVPSNSDVVELNNGEFGTTMGRTRSGGSLRLSQRKESEGSKPIILSVDDDIVNQEVIRSALSDRYVLHVAMNGFEAMEYFSTRSMLPDLVLLDVMMPGMDGFEVLKQIREEKKISPTNLPVIMLSATEPMDKALILSLQAGANDYVSKPFDTNILKARVSTAVEIKRLRQIEDENFHYSKLLHDILPCHIVERLILGDNNISERHDSVCMLFSDIVGWTPMSESIPTQQLVDLLNQVFSAFDALTEIHGVFKADTIGDAYIVAAGHEGQAGSPDATLRVAEFAMDMLERVKSIKPPNGMKLQIRVGIHTGPAYSGVVGSKVPKFTFFGDTVNTAARLEQTGVPGCINMSNYCRQTLASEVARSGRSLEGWLSHMCASIVRRDPIKVKGKGEMELFLLCPKGVSPPLAKRLSQAQSSLRESALNTSQRSESSLRNEDMLASEVRLKEEISRLEVSHREARAEVEILRSSLAESTALRSQDKIDRELSIPENSHRPTRNVPHRHSLNSRLSSLSSSPPLDAPSHLQQIEELKIQLLVTTKSLIRARQTIMDKDNEIDEMELRQLRISSRLQENASNVQPRSTDLTGAISASTSGRNSFMNITQQLLRTPSNNSLNARSRERSSSTLENLNGDFNR